MIASNLFTFFIFLPIITLASSYIPDRVHPIYSPRVTDFGTWGSWEYCPQGKFVNGFQLKTEPHVGSLPTEDDTSLNAVKLFCGPIGSTPNENLFITSKQGPWGKWGNIFPCVDNSTAIGIQLRVEGPQGPVIDDTGANNMRLLCSDLLNHEGDGMIWGRWRNPSICPRKSAICGLRTLVEEPRKKTHDINDIIAIDDTALNNIDIACCDIPSQTLTCKPTERWEFVAFCDNLIGETDKKCDFENKNNNQGNIWTDESQLSKTYHDLGINVDEEYVKLIKTLQNTLGKSARSGFDWRSFGGSLVQRKAKIRVAAPAGQRKYLYRLLAKCGIYHLNTEYYKIFDDELKPEFTSYE